MKDHASPIFFGIPASNERVESRNQSFSLLVTGSLCSVSGAQPALHSGGAILMKSHSMTSSCLSKRGTTFSQKVTYNNNVFLPADTKSIVYKHTYAAQRWLIKTTFYNSVRVWITSVKRNFWLHAIRACTEQHSTYQMHWENWWLRVRVYVTVRKRKV